MSRPRKGTSRSLQPPEGQSWVWMTTTMLGSLTFRALSVNARRILDFLLYEHASHAGKENGNLAAPYVQLAVWGVTTDDARRGLEELYVTGFVELVHQGQRVDGGGEPSRYALTWFPTHHGTPAERPPTHEWQRVIDRLLKEGIGDLPKVKRWLRERVAEHNRGARRKKKATPHLRVISPLKSGASAT